MSSSPPPSGLPTKKWAIALVSCSTRKPRLNPFITNYIYQIITGHGENDNKGPLHPDVSVEILDIADQCLPLYDEPAVPSHLPEADPTPHYAHVHTRSWSRTVRQYDSFIFVTPQYNWSVPASLKNALDYLYFEWKGKPVAIVSYGGRGGGKAAAHLREILTGLRMRPVRTTPALVTSVSILESCERLGRVSDSHVETWRATGVETTIQQMLMDLQDELKSSNKL